MSRPAATALPLIAAEELELRRISRFHGTPQTIVRRCNIVLGAAAGMANKRLARQLSTTITTVLLWRRRFEQEGLEGILHDRPRAGRPRQISLEKEGAIVEATHWTVRTMALSQGVSPATVQRIWRAYRLNPHRRNTLSPARDQSALARTRSN